LLLQLRPQGLLHSFLQPQSHPGIATPTFTRIKHHAGDLGDDLWHTNSYVKDVNKTAHLLNVTNCWICMHMPRDSRGGLVLHGVPFNASGYISTPCTTNSTANLAKVPLLLRELAALCIHSNRSVNGTIHLGHWPKCNRTRYWGFTASECENNWENLLTKVTNDNTISTKKVSNENMTTWEVALCMDLQTFAQVSNSMGLPYSLPTSHWFLCSEHAYKQVPSNWSGMCTFGLVIPTLYQLTSLPTTRLRNKREVQSDLTLGGNVGTQISRALIPPLGISMNYRDIHVLNNWTVAMFNDTIKSLKQINQELSEVRQVTLQNRYALDIILAAKGGVCALIHSHCCMYIHNYEPNITSTVQHMESMIAQNPLSPGTGTDPWSWLTSWLPNEAWLRNLFMGLIACVAMFVSLCCCIQCIPSLLTTLKSCMPSSHQPSRDALVLQKQKKCLWDTFSDDNLEKRIFFDKTKQRRCWDCFASMTVAR
uniref:Envelope protein syncytin-Car1 n=1 Tax=Laticauda laticaudata TaxID=8630 RepID=A0A8C5S5U4_LATLA